MRKTQKILAVVLALVLVFGLSLSAFADVTAEFKTELAGDYSGKTVILHSNDIHGVLEGYAYIAQHNQATIHNRYDTPALLSDAQLQKDSAFIAAFTRRMATAAVCPVKREIPESVRKELDHYLNRKRRDA